MSNKGLKTNQLHHLLPNSVTIIVLQADHNFTSTINHTTRSKHVDIYLST